MTDSNDLYNVLALCNFCILANVLDDRTYLFPDDVPDDSVVRQRLRSEFDLNLLTPVERSQFSYFRGVALNLINWLNNHYAAKDANTGATTSIKELASDYLRRQACCILNYKARAAKLQRAGPISTVADIRHQLDKLFNKPLLGLDASMLGEMMVGTIFEFHCKPTQYTIFASTSDGPQGASLQQIRNNTYYIYCLAEVEAAELGRTEADDSFWIGYNSSFKLPEDTDAEESDVSMENLDDNQNSDDGENDAMVL